MNIPSPVPTKMKHVFAFDSTASHCLLLHTFLIPSWIDASWRWSAGTGYRAWYLAPIPMHDSDPTPKAAAISCIPPLPFSFSSHILALDVRLGCVCHDTPQPQARVPKSDVFGRVWYCSFHFGR